MIFYNKHLVYYNNKLFNHFENLKKNLLVFNSFYSKI